MTTIDKTALLNEALTLGVPGVDENTSGPALELAVNTAKAMKGGSAPAATSTATPPVTSLADLPPELRAQLLEEAKADLPQTAASTAALEAISAATVAAEERNAHIRQLLEEGRAHKRDCPVELGGSGRVEAYEQIRPPRPSKGLPAEQVTVLACLECGERHVMPGQPSTYDL